MKENTPSQDDRKKVRRRARVGAPDPSLTATSGVAATAEFVDKVDVVGMFDRRVGSIKRPRPRRHLGWAVGWSGSVVGVRHRVSNPTDTRSDSRQSVCGFFHPAGGTAKLHSCSPN